MARAPRTPEQLERKRITDAAYRARAQARAASLGISRSAALGKPNRGEATKAQLGIDLRTKAGTAAAEARAAAQGAQLVPTPKLQRVKTAGFTVVQGTPSQVNRSLLNLSPRRLVQITVQLRDPNTGATRTVQPWGRGGIRAGSLQQLVRAAGGNMRTAIINAMGSAQAGSTDLDAFDVAGAGIESVTMMYR
jgi:hypothetical protein